MKNFQQKLVLNSTTQMHVGASRGSPSLPGGAPGLQGGGCRSPSPPGGTPGLQGGGCRSPSPPGGAPGLQGAGAPLTPLESGAPKKMMKMMTCPS